MDVSLSRSHTLNSKAQQNSFNKYVFERKINCVLSPFARLHNACPLEEIVSKTIANCEGFVQYHLRISTVIYYTGSIAFHF